jgi:hypothetical protein
VLLGDCHTIGLKGLHHNTIGRLLKPIILFCSSVIIGDVN